MSTVKKIIYIGLVLLSCMFIGCSLQLPREESESGIVSTESERESISVQIPEYTYEPSQYSLRFIEDYGISMIYNDKTEDVTVENVTYRFDSEIEPDKRNRCVYWTQEIVKRLGISAGLNIYVFNEYEGVWIEENGLYTGTQEFESVEYIMEVLLTASGGYANYGVVYGLANHVAAEFGWESDIAGEKDFTDAGTILDLNYLCFNTAFVSDTEVAIAKDIALRFANDFIAETGLEAFTELVLQSGSPETAAGFNEALTAWYLANGINYVPATMFYGPGGERYEFLAMCEYARFYIPREWKETTHSERFHGGFLHEDYGFVKEYFEVTREQMTALRELFGFDDYNNDLNIVFDGSKKSSYYGPGDDIFIKSSISVMHEYTHALTRAHERSSGDMVQWITEGGATYYSQKYDRFRYEVINYHSNYRHELYGQEHEGYNFSFLDQFSRELGRTIDLNRESDFREYNNLICYTYNAYSLTFHPTDAGASFIQYLVDIYGEKKVQDYLFAPESAATRAELIFGELDRPLTELHEDWKAFIEDKYSHYGKYAQSENARRDGRRGICQNSLFVRK